MMLRFHFPCQNRSSKLTKVVEESHAELRRLWLWAGCSPAAPWLVKLTVTVCLLEAAAACFHCKKQKTKNKKKPTKHSFTVNLYLLNHLERKTLLFPASNSKSFCVFFLNTCHWVVVFCTYWQMNFVWSQCDCASCFYTVSIYVNKRVCVCVCVCMCVCMPFFQFTSPAFTPPTHLLTSSTSPPSVTLLPGYSPPSCFFFFFFVGQFYDEDVTLQCKTCFWFHSISICKDGKK